MKHLLSGVAVAAMLAIAAPVWAQGGGNPMGMPGPSPGGPGLTPYSTGQTRPAAASPAAAAAPSASSSSVSDTTSAMPPKHRHARAHPAAHAKTAMHHGPRSTTDTADQLNQQELARLQGGNLTNPPAASFTAGAPSPAPQGRMSGPKSAGSGYISPTPGAGTTPPAPSPTTAGPVAGGAR